MSTQPAPGRSTNKLRIASRILTADGILLLVVAAIHLLVTPELRRLFAGLLPAREFDFLWPPFLLNHVVVGILLVPLGLSTLHCASGVRAGQRWSWSLGITNALTLLTLPVVLLAVMERRYFQAPLFLTAAALITAVALSMVWPILWVRRELQ